MHITKLGHCCLQIEVGGLSILIDPGNFTTSQNDARGISLVLITHEHDDHLHLSSLKKVLEHNPAARVFTNRGVGAILKKERINFELLEGGDHTTVSGVRLEGHGEKHAPIYPGWREVINTGYFIADCFFYPGDAFYQPAKAVKILALPVAGPWMKISEAIDYAKAVHPHRCFPVHDGALKFNQSTRLVPPTFLTPLGIEFFPLEDGSVVHW